MHRLICGLLMSHICSETPSGRRSRPATITAHGQSLFIFKYSLISFFTIFPILMWTVKPMIRSREYACWCVRMVLSYTLTHFCASSLYAFCTVTVFIPISAYAEIRSFDFQKCDFLCQNQERERERERERDRQRKKTICNLSTTTFGKIQTWLL